MKKAPTKEVIAKTKKVILRHLEGLERQTKAISHFAESQTSKYIIRKLDNNQEQTISISFKYVKSKFCRYVTFFAMLAVIGLFVFLFLSSSGTYLSAWYLSIALAILLLYLISFPTYIKLGADMMEIHGMLEITPIHYADIKRAYKIKRYRLKSVYPLVGSYGFGGFFGYYFDFKQFRIVYMYATRLSNLIAIDDIYNDKYIISCEDPDLFIAELKRAKEASVKLK